MRPAHARALALSGRLAIGLAWLAVTTPMGCSSESPSLSGPSSPAPSDAGGSEEERGFDGSSTPACIEARGDRVQSGVLDDDRGQATVDVQGSACSRRFVLTSTADRRDRDPESPRTVIEAPGRPSLQTRNPLFDALYQLALEEAEQCAVDRIRDGAFRGGEPLSCSPAGCYETGRKWTYVWTRDTAYATDLGLAWLDPLRVKSSLEFKLSTRREGDDLQIVQDTGTGGSYPVSTDRAVWALGARRALLHLTGHARDELRDRAAEAIANTIEHDRAVVFDPRDGLYRGEQSFLDWREQSYPKWVVPDTVHVAMSKALSTNVSHLALLETGAELAEELGDRARAARFMGWASDLRRAMRARLWLDEDGQLSTAVTTELDPAPARRFDLLGTSLAVLNDVLDAPSAARAIAGYPVLPKGPPVVFPQEQDTPIYHNRAIWPFVTAYWIKAARKVGNASAVDLGVDSLVRGAALNLSNVENLELVSGKPWVDDGPFSGPVVNSQRQLWSIAGYVSMVHDVLFGLRPTRDGLEVAPFITASLRRTLFASADSLVLNNVPLRGKQVSVVIALPPRSADVGGAYRVARVRLNGITQRAGKIAEASLASRNLVEVELSAEPGPEGTIRRIDDVSDYRSLFAPRTPSISVSRDEITIDVAGEDPASVVIDVYRDGERVAKDLPGWTKTWRDSMASESSPSHCYTVATRYVVSGNVSHRARPACFWGAGLGRIVSIPAASFAVQGGRPVKADGRFFHEGWGDPDHTIAATFTASRSGPHLVEAVYSNAAGPINTGITCAVKRVDVEDVTSGERVASGYLVMPQRGDPASWGDSSYVRASLSAGTSYRVVLRHDARAVNMSAFAHFESYTGGTGGQQGAHYRVRVAALKVLSLAP